jgi:hypothetical protein
MGGAALWQAIQADRASGNPQWKEPGTSWGAEWDTFRIAQVKAFQKTLPNQFLPEKYREAGLQEGMRRRRLTLAPILEEPFDIFQKIWRGG